MIHTQYQNSKLFEEERGLDMYSIKGTTIISVRKDKEVAIGCDGQVTMGESVIKHSAIKIRKLFEAKVLVGFSGSTADSLALMERFEEKLKNFNGNLLKSATELAKEWRTDKILRRLESLMIAVSKEHSILISGSGDVILPDDGILGIGSGGGYAVAAARALINHTDLSAKKIVEIALQIASDICIYTNKNFYIETL